MMSSSELWQSIRNHSWMSDELNEAKRKKLDMQKEEQSVLRKLYSIEVEFWTRLSTPLQAFVFIFLAFCLGIKRAGRQGTFWHRSL